MAAKFTEEKSSKRWERQGEKSYGKRGGAGDWEAGGRVNKGKEGKKSVLLTAEKYPDICKAKSRSLEKWIYGGLKNGCWGDIIGIWFPE